MHGDSGRRCLVLHHDGDGSCVYCPKCGKYIRPRDMSGACMPEASRLTPDILKRIDSDIHGYQTGDWVPDGHAHTTAIMLLEEAARVITALREQLRAYRGAERIAWENWREAEAPWGGYYHWVRVEGKTWE